MKIAVLGATQRGVRFVRRLFELVPNADFVIVTFPEDPREPRFVADLEQAASERGAQFRVVRNVGSEKVRSLLNGLDLLFAVSWRFVVPDEIRAAARIGSFVFHDSLLPEYRGFAPTVWSIANGEDHTGVTLMVMSEQVDEGDIIAQELVPIGPDDTIAILLERVTDTYLRILGSTIQSLLTGTFDRHPQDHERATYTCARAEEDNRIEWSWDTVRIYDLIRASTSPYPGAYTTLDGQKLRVWSASRAVAARRYVGRRPGRVVETRKGGGAVVMTGDGLLRLETVQREGEDSALRAGDVLTSIRQTLGS